MIKQISQWHKLIPNAKQLYQLLPNFQIMKNHLQNKKKIEMRKKLYDTYDK